MKVEKVTPKVIENVTITVTMEEAKILQALANLPAWFSQKEEVGDFCGSLYEALEDQTGEWIHAEKFFNRNITV